MARQPGRRWLHDVQRGHREVRGPPEQAVALADDESKFYLLGAYDILASFFTDEDRLGEAYGSAAGLHWSEHDHRLFAGTEAFFRARLPPAPGRSPRRDVRSRNPGIELETTEQADTQHRCVKA